MKLIFTLFFALFLSFVSTGQYTINPDVILFETTGEDFEVNPTVTNNTDGFSKIYWMFERGENFPVVWSTVVCDAALCYAENTFKSSALFPNNVEAGESFEFKFTVTTKGVGGASYGILHLYDDEDCTNEVATSIMPVTSVNTEIQDRLSVYPNPTQDYFSIKEDDDIKSIEIFNAVGQFVLRKSHKKDESHSISNLANGGYIVVLRDAENKIVNSLQLKKE